MPDDPPKFTSLTAGNDLGNDQSTYSLSIVKTKNGIKRRRSWTQEEREQMRCLKRLRVALPMDEDQDLLFDYDDLFRKPQPALSTPPHSMAKSIPEPTGAFPKRKRSRAPPPPPGRCHSCNRAETPIWRQGPDGPRTLCNACGLHYAQLTRKNKRKT